MSAYVILTCEFVVDKEILCQALTKLGLQYEEHEKATALMGWGNDLREQTAEIVVRKNEINKKYTKLSNDIGFKWDKTNQRYDIVCSDYDRNMKMDERIKQAYAATALEKEMKRRGFKIENEFCGQRNFGDVVTVGKKVI
jgi:hypothetical protein